jgi:acyl-CoA hydrolase
MAPSAANLTLRFLAAPTDVSFGGTVHGGKILEWIDRAGYACAVGWSGSYCVTAYIGNVRFTRPVQIGQLVEVQARLIYTGRSSMHILLTVQSADPKTGVFVETTQCLSVFVAVNADGRPSSVNRWEPRTDEDRSLEQDAIRRIYLRQEIQDEMASQTFSAATQSREVALRFLAAPTDVNWGGKVHGGTVMRWIDEAAYVCAVSWSGQYCVAVYAGGVRFYQPVLIGNLVEVQARLLYTGRTSMHLAVHVRSSDLKTAQSILTTECLLVFVALDELRRPTPVRCWQPTSPEDRALEQHAIRLMELRGQRNGPESQKNNPGPDHGTDHPDCAG